MGLLIRLLILMLIGAGGMALAARFVFRGARSLLGFDGEDHVGKARAIAERIYAQLEATTGSKNTYGAALKQITDIAEDKLPQLAETYGRLQAYLDSKPRSSLEKQVDSLRRELVSTSDSDLRRIVEKNLHLACDRLDSHARISTLRDRTLAQIRNVLLTLESLEDRMVSLKLASADHDIVPELEGMLADVNQLEGELKSLELIE